MDIPSGKVTAIVACSAESYDEQADGPDHHQEENGDRERVVDAFMEACWPLSYSSQTATSFEGDVTVHGRSIQDWNKQYLSGLMTYLKKNELPMNIQAGTAIILFCTYFCESIMHILGAYAGCPPNASPTVRENFLIAAELSGAARIISELPYGPATLINDGASKLASSDHSTHLTNGKISLHLDEYFLILFVIS